LFFLIKDGGIIKTYFGYYGGWNIWLISGKRYEMLALYEKDYARGIGENIYIILSNLPGGGIGSMRFNFVDKDQILAKVEPYSL